MSFLFGGKKESPVTPEPVTPPVVAKPPAEGPVPMDELLKYADSFIGVLYQWGGDFKRWKEGKDFGLDCSGFEQALAAYQGIDQPGDQTADGIFNWYKSQGATIVADGFEQAGDRVFYEGAQVDSDYTHIAMVVAKGRIIGANHGGSAYKTKEYALAHGGKVSYDDINYRKDKHVILRPRIAVAAPKPDPTPLPTQVTGAFSVPGFRPEWTDAGMKLLDSLLPKYDAAAKDFSDRFFPGYNTLPAEGRKRVILTLFGAIASYESGMDSKTGFFKTSVVYRESNGVDSEGLFQLSYGDSHAPKNKSEADLFDPITNLLVALKIGADHVVRDSVVCAGGYPSYGAPAPKGLARYWSVVRVPDSKSSHHLADIISKTKKAQV